MKPKDRARVKRLESLQPLTSGGGSLPGGTGLVKVTGGVGGVISPPVLQTTWFQDYVAGVDTNPGTALAPVKTIAEIYRRYLLNAQLSTDGIVTPPQSEGGRPILSASITVNMVSAAPDSSDPVLILANIDLGPGVKVTIQPSTTDVKRSGTLNAIVNPFARTPTGQLTVHDLGVVSWASDVDFLFIDTTQGATSWVTAAPGANGVLAAVRPTQPVTAIGVDTLITSGLGAVVTVGGADSYQIVRPLSVYLGGGSELKATGGSNPTVNSAFVLHRLHAVTAFVGEALSGVSDAQGVGGTLPGAFMVFVECRFDTDVHWLSGGAMFANCAFTGAWAIGGASVETNSAILAGYGRGEGALTGGFVDQDHSLIVANPLDGYVVSSTNPSNTLANCSRYGGAGADGAILVIAYAFASFAVVFDPGPTVRYGTVTPGGNILKVAQLGIAFTEEAPTAFSILFQFDSTTFVLGGLSSAYGFNEATGVYVGPTTCTIAHLDAALGAGTGFGRNALDPKSNARFGDNLA